MRCPPGSYNRSVAMIQSLSLGRVPYDEALKIQEELVALRLAGRIENTLLLLEHPPVLTLGRNASRANILASEALLTSRGVTVHEINRGGDVTFHGPGQLIGYPIFDLRSLANPNGGRLGPVDFVRLLEEALIRLCAVYGVHATRIPGLTGVWCPADGKPLDQSSGSGTEERSRPQAKIGAIGIHVSRGVTSHGFAFNVTTDLDFFRLINPCGITDRPVTSLAREVPDPASIPSLESIAHQAARQFGLVFHEEILALASLDDLRAEATTSPSAELWLAAPQLTPLQVEEPQGLRGSESIGTPLQIPPEVERLLDPHFDPRTRPARA
ncbi:MAG TPA: lipoyl(octanoyl) transferase LipB [Terracidiphilus sp.]